MTLNFILQTEIAKRLSAIIGQVLPFLAQEHQQQVASAVERAKQVTMTELNAIIGVRFLSCRILACANLETCIVACFSEKIFKLWLNNGIKNAPVKSKIDRDHDFFALLELPVDGIIFGSIFYYGTFLQDMPKVYYSMVLAKDFR